MVVAAGSTVYKSPNITPFFIINSYLDLLYFDSSRLTFRSSCILQYFALIFLIFTVTTIEKTRKNIQI